MADFTLTVTIVDHTNSPKLMPLIMKHLEDIFLDLLTAPSTVSVVNMRSVTALPGANEQDLVLHFVNDIASSYVAANMPGSPIPPQNGGLTRPRADKTGSEFYKFPQGFPKGATALGYAKLAAHEAMHNVTRMDDNTLHPKGGIGGYPGKLPVNDDNRKDFQKGMSNIPNQLL